MAGIYRNGLDENGQWEASMANHALERDCAIVDLGQVPAWMRKQLDARVKSGELAKYRGHWNTLSPVYGMGPLKTIWATPEVATVALAHAA
jgi:hypothetical protein